MKTLPIHVCRVVLDESRIERLYYRVLLDPDLYAVKTHVVFKDDQIARVVIGKFWFYNEKFLPLLCPIL